MCQKAQELLELGSEIGKESVDIRFRIAIRNKVALLQMIVCILRESDRKIQQPMLKIVMSIVNHWLLLTVCKYLLYDWTNRRGCMKYEQSYMDPVTCSQGIRHKFRDGKREK